MNSRRDSCVRCCCCTNGASDDEDSRKTLCHCPASEDEENRSKCAAAHHRCLGFIFPRLMDKIVEKTEMETVLLIAGRRVPSSSCHRIHVYSYLTVMAILTVLWFLVTLLEHIIYHSATSCNEIDTEDRYYVCFDLSANWSIVDCQMKNQSNNIFCYTYSITPSAFAIAFSMASFVSTTISVTFYSAVYCSDERCSRRGLIVIQFLLVIATICCAVSLAVLFATEKWTSVVFYLFDGRAPLRGVLIVLCILSLLILGSCLPWAPFQSKRIYETVASGQP